MKITPTTKAMYTGLVDLKTISADNINLDRITIELSRRNRWGTAHDETFSVASHSLLVGHEFVKLKPEATCAQLACALLHDAAEAYITDLTNPDKEALRDIAGDRPSDFDVLEQRIQDAILTHFKIRRTASRVKGAIKKADEIAKDRESWALFDRPQVPEWRTHFVGCASMRGLRFVQIVPEEHSEFWLNRMVRLALTDSMCGAPARELWGQLVEGREAA